jgi:DNA-directed RNA polymerase specialized sigma24 family protein
VTLDPSALASDPVDADVLDLDAALTALAAIDSRRCRVAELRFFGGLSLEEIGTVLDVSLATVERDWQLARAWLFDALSALPSNDS